MPEDIDRLKRLRDDCNTHKGRLRKAIAEGTIDVGAEISTTLLPLLTDSVELMMEIRDGYGESLQDLGEDVEEHEDRIEALESAEGVTILMPEDAETFSKIIAALRTIATDALEKGGLPTEVEGKLRESLALCATGDAIIEHSKIPEDDTEEDASEQDDTDEPPDVGEPPPGAPS